MIVWCMCIPCTVQMGLSIFLIIYNFLMAGLFETHFGLKTKSHLCSTLLLFVVTQSTAQQVPFLLLYLRALYPLFFLPASPGSKRHPDTHTSTLHSRSTKSISSDSISFYKESHWWAPCLPTVCYLTPEFRNVY